MFYGRIFRSIIAREDVSELIQMAIVENLMNYMRMANSPNQEFYKKKKERFDKIIADIRNNIQVEPVECS